eukprot:TRINITY_DN104821_c0_g1_i1.p1 TRINITY_DN104821_c0_g1~~TRINITY_DN104821_c0_g1_i1.p1  ORF type:complete len:251 (+),score=101.58 TRINITY_DN104821_c0_g1_i1:77-754(+)
MAGVLAVALRGSARQLPLLQRRALPALRSQRCFSAAAPKVIKVLSAEISHEEGEYEQPKEVKTFLKSSPFKLVEADGDVNMALEREMDGKVVRVEWQLSSPFDPEADLEGGEGSMPQATDLSISVEKKSDGSGIMFYCSTQSGEDHRYIIGNIRSYASSEEKDLISAYNGPEFEDLDDKLQEAFDEYLAELGMSPELCDFVDATATDKEQREYVRWLKNAKKFLE